MNPNFTLVYVAAQSKGNMPFCNEESENTIGSKLVPVTSVNIKLYGQNMGKKFKLEKGFC